jgi:excisionase family DNA binding protein
MSEATNEKLLLSAAEAAGLLGISRSAYYSLLSSGRIGPLPVRLGRSVRFDRRELERWVAAKCPCRDGWVSIKGTRNV